MTSPSTVIGNWNESGYPKTDHFHGIRPGNFFRRKTEARHVKEVVGREKLHSLQLRTPAQQKALIALESLDGCCMKEIDDIKVIFLEAFLPEVIKITL